MSVFQERETIVMHLVRDSRGLGLWLTDLSPTDQGLTQEQLTLYKEQLTSRPPAVYVHKVDPDSPAHRWVDYSNAKDNELHLSIREFKILIKNLRQYSSYTI